MGRRLRVYAAINRRTVIDVVGAALDSYLPPLADLVSTATSEGGQASGRMALEQPEPGHMISAEVRRCNDSAAYPGPSRWYERAEQALVASGQPDPPPG